MAVDYYAPDFQLEHLVQYSQGGDAYRLNTMYHDRLLYGVTNGAMQSWLRDIPGFTFAAEAHLLFCTALDSFVAGGNAAVELGTYRGRTLAWLAMAADIANKLSPRAYAMGTPVLPLVRACNAYGVDNFVGVNDEVVTEPEKGKIFSEVFGSIHATWPNVLRHRAHVLRQSTVEASNNSLIMNPDTHVGMLFIDAGHSEAEVLEDFSAWKNVMRNYVVFHDYGRGAGVEAVVDKLADEGYIEKLLSVYSLMVCKITFYS